MKKNRLNWIDRSIAYINPKWGYQRAAWREGFSKSYDAGDTGRLNAGWVVANAPAEQTNQAHRDKIRARARDLERNSDVAEAIVGNFERNVVGVGITLQAKVKDANGNDDKDLNERIEYLWKKWCKAKNCDITGQQSFAEMLRMAERRSKVDGGILFIKSYAPDRKIPLVLQAREVDDIDKSIYSLSTPSGNRIINGIELDRYNKPIAYHLKTVTPDGLWEDKTERIEANRVISLLNKKRPSQIREISELARTAPRVRDTNEFIEAQSVKERVLACLSVFIKKVIPGNGLGRGSVVDKQSGYTQKTLTPAMITELNAGDEVQVVNPSGQSSNARDFISIQQRLAGSGMGLSYEAVSRDMSQVNYSSARQGFLQDQITYKIDQEYLKEHLCSEVYIEFLISAWLAGELDIPDFWQNQEKYMEHDWIAPGWSWIDPLKEVNANKIAVATGQTTLAEICASNGKDWREIMKQRSKEQQYAQELGLILGDNTDASSIIKDSESGDDTKKNV